ncbi:MAG TPA: GNAT family N-acetyltransferase [Candidatus Kapabacteria bacterium]|jgi:predicted GNAT family acetyltransferase|nr:GNAT family N-acetyltransferase [Candidatus Kapabacteria bacterium]
MPEAVEVVDNPERHRFEARVDGILSQVGYRINGNEITFTHTEVPESLSGRGIANQLAQTALNFARDNRMKVVPLCPFIAAYIKRHPEYQALVADKA